VANRWYLRITTLQYRFTLKMSFFRSIRNLCVKNKKFYIFNVFHYSASTTQKEIFRKSSFYEQNKRRWLSIPWKIAGVVIGAFLLEFHYHNKLFATSKSMCSFQIRFFNISSFISIILSIDCIFNLKS
jgi:hypothetical protein